MLYLGSADRDRAARAVLAGREDGGCAALPLRRLFGLLQCGGADVALRQCKVVMSDSYKVTMTEPTAGPRPRAADDDMVTKRLRALSGQRGLLGCNVRDGKSSGECWCYQAGPNGETLPCPPVEVTQTIKESQTEITKEPKALPLTNLQGEITGSCPHCQTNRVPCAGHCFGC